MGLLPDISQQEDLAQMYLLVKGDMNFTGIQFSPKDALKFFTMQIKQYLLINCMIID